MLQIKQSRVKRKKDANSTNSYSFIRYTFHARSRQVEIKHVHI